MNRMHSRIALFALVGMLVLPAAALNPQDPPSSGPPWVWQNPLPQGNDLGGVAFVNATTGWTVGDLGTILVTTNAGSTWTFQKSGTREDLTGVAFASATRGWAVGTGGRSFQRRTAAPRGFPSRAGRRVPLEAWPSWMRKKVGSWGTGARSWRR